MAERTFYKEARYLFFIPSFYGAATWGAWLLLYTLKLIRVESCGAGAMALFLAVELFFLLSAAVSFPYYRAVVGEGAQTRPHPDREGGEGLALRLFLLLAHASGFAGIALYVVEFSRNLGGITGFFFALVNEAYAIRWEAETSASVGTQLSYLGWVAIALTGYLFAGRRISGRWLAPALLQFLGNFLFIDRTRPFWILFTVLFMILPAARTLETRRIVRLVAGAGILALTIFCSVAVWTGKTSYEGKFDDSALPGLSQEIYAYGISGFAYFNHLLESGEEVSYRPERVLYPAFRLLSRTGVTREPPAQILDFFEVPFSTNVGTFLEPFYRDGGLIFVLCGIVIYSFGFDLMGWAFLKSGNPLAVYAWANLCFATFMVFFTPQATFFPSWLFTALGGAGLLIRSLGAARSRGHQAAEVRP
jgi:oligosaccharide repeat unit polymerase